MSKNYVLAVESLEEIEKSKRAQIPCSVQLTAPPDYSAGFKLNAIRQTSIEQKAEPFKFFEQIPLSSKPVIPGELSAKQPAALGIEIAKAIQRNEKILRNIVNVLIRNIQARDEKIISLHKEDEKYLNELIDQLSKKEDANMVKSLLNIITSSTAITVGSILLAPQTVSAITASAAGAALYSSVSGIWAYLMIVSGVSNIVTGELLPKIGGYEKIAGFFTLSPADRKNLAHGIQITATLANTVMGIASSIAAGPLITAVLDWSHGLKVLNTSLELSKGAANFVSGLSEHSYNKLQSRQTIHDSNLSKEQSGLDKDFMELHSAADLQQAFNKLCFNIFETLRKIQQQITS